MKTFKHLKITKIFVWMLTILLVCPYSFAAQVGEVTFIDGRVDILKAGEDVTRPLRGNEPVDEGDIIRTMSNAKAEITFVDRSALHIAEKSRIEVQEYKLHEDLKRKDATINIHRGKIRAIIAKMKDKAPFNIDTVNAHGTIKGSEVIAFFQAGATGMLVSSGNLSVVNPVLPSVPPIMVTPGNSILIPQEGAPKGPRPFLDLEKKFHENDTTPPFSVARRKKVNTIEGVVTKVSGDVMITLKGEKEARELEVNAFIKTDDVVVTGDDGLVELKFDNGNSINMKPNTHFRILKLFVDPKTQEFENEFEVTMGEIKAVVDNLKGGSTFKIKTPQAVAGVRGTIMFLIVTQTFTKAFFEGGPGYIKNILSGITKEVPMGESSTAFENGSVSDPLPVLGLERSSFAQGWVPGNGVEGYSAPEGVTNNYLFDNESSIQEVQGSGEGDNEIEVLGVGSNSDNTEIPLTETNDGDELLDNDPVVPPLPVEGPGDGPVDGPGDGPGDENPIIEPIGGVAGFFGSYDLETNQLNNSGGIFEGEVFIDGSPFAGSHPVDIAGVFDTDEGGSSDNLFQGAFGAGTEDGASILGSFSGVNNSLLAMLHAFYIRPNPAGGFLAGYISSNDLFGDFVDADNTFFASGLLNTGFESPTEFSPDQLVLDNSILLLDPELNSVVVGDNITGNITLDPARIQGQEWGVFDGVAGGFADFTPEGNWSSRIGGAFSDENGYFYGSIGGDAWLNGEFSASLGAMGLTNDSLISYNGQLLGTYMEDGDIYESIYWQSVAGGVVEYDPLHLSGMTMGVFGDTSSPTYGTFNSLIGTTDSIFSQTSDLYLIGEFQNTGTVQANLGPLWAGGINGQTMDGAIFTGILGGTEVNGILDGLANALYIRPNDSGGYLGGLIYSDDFLGNVSPEIGLFSGLGEISTMLESPTSVTPANFATNNTGIDINFLGDISFTGDITSSAASPVNALSLADQNWEIFTGASGGNFTIMPSGNWVAAFGTNSEDFTVTGEVTGQSWGNNQFRATISGQVMTDERLGTITGQFIGTYTNDGEFFLDGNQWLGFLQGYIEYQSLAFMGSVTGQFGSLFSGDFHENEGSSFSGNVGGLDSFFDGDQVITLQGEFNNPNSENKVFGSTDFNFSGEENGAAFVGNLFGTKSGDALRATLSALYIRPDSNNVNFYRAGALRANSISGNFIEATNMFLADGPVSVLFDFDTIFTPAQLLNGQAYEINDSREFQFVSDFGRGQLTQYNSKIIDQDWSLWSIVGGGSYTQLPVGFWSAVLGNVTFGQPNELNYTILHVRSAPISNGHFETNIDGAYSMPQSFTLGAQAMLNRNTLQGYIVNDQGRATGIIEDNNWQLISAGVGSTSKSFTSAAAVDGAFNAGTTGDIENDFILGSFSAIFGSVDSAFSVGSLGEFLLIGEFQSGSNLWSTVPFSVVGRSNDGSFLGTVNGTRVNDALKGLFNGFYITQNGQAGYASSSNFNGSFYPGLQNINDDTIGLFEGRLDVQRMFEFPTVYTPQELSNYSAIEFDEASQATLSSDNFAGSMQISSANIIDQNWAIINGYVVGGYETIPNDNWTAAFGGASSEFASNNPNVRESYFLGSITGDAWQNGELAGHITGRTLDQNSENPLGSLGIIEGNLIGAYIENTSSWQAVTNGYIVETPALFFGNFDGAFGSFNDGPGNVDFSNGNVSGLLGGIDSFLAGTSEVTLLGDFTNSNNDSLWSTPFNLRGATIDGGAFLGALAGHNNSGLDALLYGIYIRPNGGGNNVGIFMSDDISGDFYSGIGMFEATGNITTVLDSQTSITPLDFSSGTAFNIGDPEPAQISGDISGVLEIVGIDIVDQDWDLLVLSGGGNYGEQPDDDWSAVIGLSDNGEDEANYLLWQVNGETFSDGEFRGSISGRDISFDHNLRTGEIIIDTGEFIGTFDSGVWEGVGFNYGSNSTPLAYASLFEGSFLNVNQETGEEATGFLSAIIGGVDLPWATDLTNITVLGEFDNPDGYPLWVTDQGAIVGETADGGRYLAISGGVLVNDEIKGHLNALYIRPGNFGTNLVGRMYSSDLAGIANSDAGIFEADGTVMTTLESPTNFALEDFFDESNIFEEGLLSIGFIQSPSINGFIASSDVSLIDQDWGIFFGSGVGTYDQMPTNDWEVGIFGLGIADEQFEFPVESWLAKIDGSRWSGNILEGSVEGIWVEIEPDGTLTGGRTSGDVIGSYVDVNEGSVWQANTTGEWVEVGEILDLAGINDDITALGSVDIPVTEVYTSLLAGAGGFQAGGIITANNVLLDFYTTDLLIDSGIWAAQLSGSYTNPTGGAFGFDVTGNLIDSNTSNVIGTVDATFAGQDWIDGQWSAIVGGSTSTGLDLSGSAAGTFDGNGGFTGAGTGIYQPTELLP